MDRPVALQSPKSNFDGGGLPIKSRGTIFPHLRNVYPRKIELR